MTKPLGVIYLALGRPYLAMALLSAKSLVNSNPELPYTIITNVTKFAPFVPFFRENDRWIYVDAEVADNRKLKTNILNYSEYEKTIFLDSDTVVMGDLSVADKILDYFDVCVRLNRYPQKRKGKGDVHVLGDVEITDLPHWNSGVMLVRNSPVAMSFFSCWNDAYIQLGNQYDQVALVPTIFESEARVLSLEDRWNATDPGVGRNRWRQETLVYHYATNICDKLFRLIMDMDSLVEADDESNHQTEAFLKRKRGLKRSQMNFLRFFLINLFWKFSSPVKL